MNDCRHTHLLLITENLTRLRCRHCHLTIKADELEDGYCPECYEKSGRKHTDFDEIIPPQADSVRYRCEDCGAMLPEK